MKRVKVSPEAREEIRGAVVWWKANRPKGPTVFSDELRRAISLLQGSPEIGALAPGVPRDSGVRFVRLRATRYLLYYSFHEGEVELLRLWHTSRGQRLP